MHRRLLRFLVALALVVPLATTTAIAAPAAPPTGLKGQITDFRICVAGPFPERS